MRMLLASLCLLAAGCTTLVETDPRDVGKGDTVRIVTREGVRSEFIVTGRDEAAIRGEAVSVALTDIEQLKVRAFDARKTGIYAFATVYLIAYVSLLIP